MDYSSMITTISGLLLAIGCLSFITYIATKEDYYGLIANQYFIASVLTVVIYLATKI